MLLKSSNVPCVNEDTTYILINARKVGSSIAAVPALRDLVYKRQTRRAVSKSF
jgi:hypothetical protein